MKKISFKLYFYLILPLLAGLAYALLALWAARDSLSNFSQYFLGAGELQGWLWRYWWAKSLVYSAFLLKHDLLYTFYVICSVSHFPEAGNMTDLIFGYWPLESLFGFASGYNLKVILILVLNGLAGYLFLREISRSELAGFVAGAFFAFNPYVLSEIATGRVRQAIIFSIPLFLYYLLKNHQKPESSSALWAGFWLGVSAIIYWFYGIFLLFSLGIFYLYLFISQERKKLSPDFWVYLLMTLLLALVIAVPYTAPYLEISRSGRKLPETTFWLTFPSLNEIAAPIGKVGVAPLSLSFKRFLDDSPSAEYLFSRVPRYGFPLILSLLALFPLYLLQKEKPKFWGFWLICLVFFYVLSLGPYLKFGYQGNMVTLGQGIGIRLPYVVLFKYFPLFSRLFSPCRLISMVSICLAVLLAFNLKWLFGKLDKIKFLPLGVSLLLLFLLFFSLESRGQSPLPVTRLYLPDFYRELAKEKVDGIIELPLGMGDLGNFYQIFHHKRVLRGWGEYSIPKDFPEGEIKWLARLPQTISPQNSFVELVKILDPGKPLPEMQLPGSFSPESLDELRIAGYRYALLHEAEFVRIDLAGGGERYKIAKSILERLLGRPVKLDSEPLEGAAGTFEIAVFKI